jgi:hypothetical protein
MLLLPLKSLAPLALRHAPTLRTIPLVAIAQFYMLAKPVQPIYGKALIHEQRGRLAPRRVDGVPLLRCQFRTISLQLLAAVQQMGDRLETRAKPFLLPIRGAQSAESRIPFLFNTLCQHSCLLRSRCRILRTATPMPCILAQSASVCVRSWNRIVLSGCFSSL